MCANILKQGEFMPYCRNCGSRITKFDKDMCPICGTKQPLQGVNSDTVEITTELKIHTVEGKKQYQAHFRLTTFLLFALIGWTGAGFFYLKFKKTGLIWLLSNLLVLGGLGALFVLLIGYKEVVGYLVSPAIVYVANIATGFFFLFKKDIKDGNGEFIR